MKRLAASTALIATAALPSKAEDDPSVFPQRGRYERLAVNYITIKIGLKKPFSVMHISDTHLTAVYPHETDKLQSARKRTITFGGRQEEALRDSLDWAKKHVDYVLHTGDLIDFQSEANYDLVKKYFGPGMFGAIGNHEFAPKADCVAELSKVYPFNIEFQSQVIEGVNFITLNDSNNGQVTQRQFDMFKAEVKRGLPIVLCMHVPYGSDDLSFANLNYWSKGKETIPAFRNIQPTTTHNVDKVTRDFIDYLRREPMLKAILAGHIHYTLQTSFSDTANIYTVGGNYMFAAQTVFFI